MDLSFKVTIFFVLGTALTLFFLLSIKLRPKNEQDAVIGVENRSAFLSGLVAGLLLGCSLVGKDAETLLGTIIVSCLTLLIVLCSIFFKGKKKDGSAHYGAYAASVAGGVMAIIFCIDKIASFVK